MPISIEKKSDFLKTLVSLDPGKELLLDIYVENPYKCGNSVTYTYIHAYVRTHARYRRYLPCVCIVSRSFLDTRQDQVRYRTRVSYDRLFLAFGSLGPCLRRAQAAKDKVDRLSHEQIFAPDNLYIHIKFNNIRIIVMFYFIINFLQIFFLSFRYY